MEKPRPRNIAPTGLPLRYQWWVRRRTGA